MPAAAGSWTSLVHAASRPPRTKHATRRREIRPGNAINRGHRPSAGTLRSHLSRNRRGDQRAHTLLKYELPGVVPKPSGNTAGDRIARLRPPGEVPGQQLTDYWFYVHRRWVFDLVLSNPSSVRLYRMSPQRYVATLGCTHRNRSSAPP